MWTRMRMMAKSESRWLSSVIRPGKTVAAVWGNGDYGRLGLGSLDSQWNPTLLVSSAFHDQNLQAIACGGAHTLFLTHTGRVFATGLNDFGSLGSPLIRLMLLSRWKCPESTGKLCKFPLDIIILVLLQRMESYTCGATTHMGSLALEREEQKQFIYQQKLNTWLESPLGW